MFCGKLRQEHQLAQSEQESADLRHALSQAESEREEFRTGMQSDSEIVRMIYSNMQSFGNFFCHAR